MLAAAAAAADHKPQQTDRRVKLKPMTHSSDFSACQNNILFYCARVTPKICVAQADENIIIHRELIVQLSVVLSES